MGCTSTNQGNNSNIPAHYLNKVTNSVIQIQDPQNVNRKYEHLMKIQTNTYVGSGYRKTHAYHCLTTREEIHQKRVEFWETRNDGLAENWQAIKKAIQAPDDKTGMGLLQKNKISLLNGSIQFCIDSHINRYELPIFIIHEPLTYSEHRLEDKNIDRKYDDMMIEIIVRSGSFPNGDFKINEQLSTNVDIVKETIRALKELPDEATIRLFYNGRQMLSQKTLGNYGFKNRSIIQAIIN